MMGRIVGRIFNGMIGHDIDVKKDVFGCFRTISNISTRKIFFRGSCLLRHYPEVSGV